MNYVVQDGQVLIVDEFTGRTMPGRRWSEGLHQAVEAKEGVQVKGETQTLATITIQNYFRMYDKLAGMTGTAETEETEFFEIYKLEVAVIPTNRPVIRDDRHDLVYKTRREKYNAILEETQRLHELGYPVLIGTVNVDVSETLSRMFKRAGMTPNVLNAKYHQREAEIVAAAGQPGAVTIATNMAGPRYRHQTRARRHRVQAVDGEGRGRQGRRDRGVRRSAHPRLRAPRVAAHRPSVARPFGTPGRSGRVAVLPVARRRSHAAVRVGADRAAHGSDGCAGGRGPHASR